MSGLCELFGSDIPVDFHICHYPRACVIACPVAHWAEAGEAWVVLGARQTFFCLLNDVFGSCMITTLKPSANARWRAALCDSWHLSTFAWKILIVTGWWRSRLSLFIWRHGLVVASEVIRLVSDSPAEGYLEGSGEVLEQL